MGSNFSQLETVISALQDEYPLLRQRGVLFRSATCVVGFLLGLPLICPGGFYFFNILDQYAAGINLLFLGLMEVVTVVFIYGYDRFSEDVSMMLGRKLGVYWRVCLRFLSVIAVSAILVVTCVRYKPLTLGDYEYPLWALNLGWLISIGSLIWLPILFLKSYCIRSGMWEEITALSRPEDRWGPPIDENRIGRYDDDDDDDEENGDDDNVKSTEDDLERRSSGVETSCYLAHKKPEIPLKFLSAHHPPPRYSMASSFASSTPTSVPIFTQAGGLKLPQREDSAISSLNMLSSTISAPSTRRDK